MSLPPFINQYLVTDEAKGEIFWYDEEAKGGPPKKAVAHAKEVFGTVTAYQFYMDEDGGEIVHDSRLEECGGCAAYHRADYDGDCRNDAERFPTPEGGEN